MTEPLDPKRIRRWRRDVYRILQGHGFAPAEIVAAMVLAAIAGFGTDIAVLSGVTGSSPDYVRKVLRRLRKERVVSGQTVRCRWMEDGFEGGLSELLDSGVAAGVFTRGVNPKASAAQKARAPETRARGPRRSRVVLPEGAMFTPQMKKSNPLYGLPEWKGADPK